MDDVEMMFYPSRQSTTKEAQQMLNGCDWSFADEDIAAIDKALTHWDKQPLYPRGAMY
jgi:hypothetical protein